ncbi:type II toxin-antitoxin system prevent-host-death family antitoxin [Corynebacterium phoceense]|uniref:type II toxin-antitoxin system prevent-host-death family antitoxin n=1 Tax=Corynebacterium phoceense TaxID=1686286 RepID=UPI0034CE724D
MDRSREHRWHPARRSTQRDHRDELCATIDESRFTGKRTIVTRTGKRVAAIVPVSDLERLEEFASFLCWSLRRSM